MTTNKGLLVVIPAFNEEIVLERTLTALLQEVSVNQVLVVNDGSTDKTSEIVKTKNIQLLELPFNLGVGAAMRAGFQFALENGFEKLYNLMQTCNINQNILKKLLHNWIILML